MMVDPERNHQLIMFNEIYGLGKDSGVPDGDKNGDDNGNESDGEGYTMDFGSLEKEAVAPTSTQAGRKRKRESDAMYSLESSSSSDEAEKSNRNDRPSSSMRAKHGRRIYYCQEEGCGKQAQGKGGRCVAHGRVSLQRRRL